MTIKLDKVPKLVEEAKRAYDSVNNSLELIAAYCAGASDTAKRKSDKAAWREMVYKVRAISLADLRQALQEVEGE